MYRTVVYQDPLALFAKVSHEPMALLLDSANSPSSSLYQNTNRYSYLCFDPVKVLLEHKNAPFNAMQELLEDLQAPKIADLPPFQGGLAGFLSYDLCSVLENIPYEPSTATFPLLALGLYDVVVSFDHQQKKAWIISHGTFEPDLVKRQSKAKERLEYIHNKLFDTAPVKVQENTWDKLPITPAFSKKEYLEAIQQAKNYILEGDIFEVNLTQHFDAQLPEGLKAFDLYCRLRKRNPAPFAAFLQLGHQAIASGSPERFLQLQDNHLQARPIKGTAPRGQTKAQDAHFAQQLQQSTKDHSENVMIVDLMRNDFSRVCDKDSVKVSKLCGLESYANVHHLVSVVEGDLQDGLGPVAVLKASFPGGSITGAPKVRAMEIIHALEKAPRGPYCGSMGYISAAGDMDLSILIRSFVIDKDHVRFQVGGAIVLDSDPQSEYQETLDKASGLIAALEGEPCYDLVD